MDVKDIDITYFVTAPSYYEVNILWILFFTFILDVSNLHFSTITVEVKVLKP